MSFYEKCRGPMFRPGGYALTKSAVEFCHFHKGAKLADIGCGTGDVMRRLHEDYMLTTVGIEPSEAMSGKARDIIRADAVNTTLASSSQDGVLCECVLSLCTDFNAALCEMNRILKPGGYLMVTDVYAKKADEVFLGGPFGYLRSLEIITEKVGAYGFEVELLSDRTDDMISMLGELIMSGKRDVLCGSYEDLKRYKCGYFLLIAKKNKETEVQR